MNTYKTEEEMQEARYDAIYDWLNKQDSDIDLVYFYNENIESFDEFRYAIEDGGGFNVDIIYYAKAIEYLAENDPSLMEAIEIASDMGYETQNINSELLASLLASQNARVQFEELEDEFTELFGSFEVQEEEEE